ncbi:MAG TPA: twin-arginine translocation signal domain-containing protein [Steroidobacteraceae bacterium]|nr:twin-arginine translocation signal domain-containing protein [Steroidobacteraceae bacterium]
MSSPQSTDRRSFVRAMGVLTGVIALGSPLASLLPGRAWAVELRVLSSAQAAALLALIRTIAPHDTLDDSAYALVVKAVDDDAAASAAARAELAAGVVSLGEGFAGKPEAARVLHLETIESGAFFQAVRIKTLMVLYNNPIAWAHFGYQGEAFSKGGYLLRGFNDLKWLPDVPLADSGPMPFG